MTTDDGLDERFRSALESILDLVVVERAIRDGSGTIVDFEIAWMNNAPVDVARRPREEMIGRRISELYPALAGGELIASYRDVVETGIPVVVPVLPYEDVIDGRPVSGYYTVQATKFEDGVLVASRDITPLETSRVELESALRELEAAQRLARLGIWHVDLHRRRTELSTELQRIFGLPGAAEGEMETAGLTERIHPDDFDAVADANERVMTKRGPATVEHRVVRADGTVAHVRTYIEAVVVNDEVVGLWGTTQDISEIIASRAALRVEHARRISAEALAEMGAVLGRTENLQEIADAVYDATQSVWPLTAAVVALTEADEVLRLYYGGSRVPMEIQARYMRTALAVDTHMTRVVNEGRPLLLTDRSAQQRAFPALAADLAATAAEGGAVLPLVRASGEVFGALALAWPDPQEFDQSMTTMLDDVAEIVARTAERLELRELERSVAQTLQLGLLAVDVRSTNVIVRTRYRASDASMEIGGDWYDAVALDDGRVFVAVGDVVGRGLAAATTMGQLRAALKVTAMQTTGVDDAIVTLDRYARHVPGAACTTVAIAVMDTAAGTVDYATAGHPPPLLVTPDGVARFLEGGRSWPLGIEETSGSLIRPPAATHELPAGSLLLLYTDGLVERRGSSIDEGLSRLQRIVQSNWNLPLRRIKEAVFRELVDVRDAEAFDDIALVAARVAGTTPALFAEAFPADPFAVRDLRLRLDPWLKNAGVEEERAEGLILAIAEAAANAIDHGSRGDASQIVKVEVASRGDGILASISDAGQWRPGAEGYFSGRGRGHLLMQGLADNVDIDTDVQGTIVTLHLSKQTMNA